MENETRSRGWSDGGVAVRLGDGNRWHLPAITRKLLASMPELRGELRAALDLATRDGKGAEAAAGLDRELARYDHLLAVVAVRLLRENYDLEVCTLEALLSFEEPVGMLSAVMSISYALDSTQDVWRPWLEAA